MFLERRCALNGIGVIAHTVTQSEPKPALCSHLDWDSKFFGLRIARLERSRLEESVLAQATEWARQNRIDCLYFLADANDPQTTCLAEQNQFLPVDVRLTFERRVPEEALRTTGESGVRAAREDDLPVLRRIAAQSHSDTRFYFDPHFDRVRCDELYATWIENSLHGFAQAVLAAEQQGQPAGYVTLHLRGDQAQIGLIAVASGAQGAGLGRRLVEESLEWARRRGARTMKVVTQGRNVPAQRLYQRCGFLTASFELWYHKWFRP
jgi:dTDP-4-amino-4,6-dideoxy-D-galactose acyltransferase